MSKRNNVIKSKLPAMWMANTKPRVTQQYLTEWMHEVFTPSVKNIFRKTGSPLKGLLLLSNAPAHPPCLEEDLVKEFDLSQVNFLPPNTTDITANRPTSDKKK